MAEEIEPTPQELRRTLLRGEVRRARAVFHAALSALNRIDGRLNAELSVATSPEDIGRAYDTYERAISDLVTVAKFTDTSPWPHPYPSWRQH